MEVRKFLGSNDSLGCVLLRFDDANEMHEIMDRLEGAKEIQRDVRVEVG